MFYYLILSILILRSHQQSSLKKINQCTSSTNCIEITSCRPFMDLINNEEKPLNVYIQKLLRTKLCGFEGENPKVCCSEIEEELKFFKNNTIISPCKAPSKCLSAQDCKPIMDLLKYPLDYEFLLTTKQCGFKQGQTKICCPGKITFKGFVKETKEKVQEPPYSLKEKADIINRQMGEYLDFGVFDLFRRKRDSYKNFNIEIEIR